MDLLVLSRVPHAIAVIGFKETLFLFFIFIPSSRVVCLFFLLPPPRPRLRSSSAAPSAFVVAVGLFFLRSHSHYSVRDFFCSDLGHLNLDLVPRLAPCIEAFLGFLSWVGICEANSAFLQNFSVLCFHWGSSFTL